MCEAVEAVVRPQIRVVLEEGDHNWSAYAPAVPGCAATGRTRRAAERNIREALTFHFEGLDEQGRREVAAMVQRDLLGAAQARQ